MDEVTLNAPAKLNLTLDILGRRKDGYHDLKMVMTSVSLYDRVSVKLRSDGRISVHVPGTDLPEGEDNLAGKAARIFFNAVKKNPGAEITIEKKIPAQAGMAGGSSDAAAVLRALRMLLCPDMPMQQLEILGEQIGSDVPYCVRGGTVLAQGRGEHLTDWPALPACFLVLCKPDFGLSTPELFARVRVENIRRHPDHAGMYHALLHGKLSEAADQMVNVFEEVLTLSEAEELTKIKLVMKQFGAKGTLMTGSGPTLFGIFEQQNDAQQAYEELGRQYRQTFLVQSI